MGIVGCGWVANRVENPDDATVYAVWGVASGFVLVAMLALCAAYWRLFDQDGGPVRPSSSSTMAAFSIVGAVVLTVTMPIWFGVFVVLAVFAVVLRPAAWREGDDERAQQRVRAVIMAAIIAGAAASSSSVDPQRFDRLESHLLEGRMQFAYIGEKGDDLVLGACNRTHEGFSKDPIALRVDRSLLGSIAIVRSGYVFYEGQDTIPVEHCCEQLRRRCLALRQADRRARLVACGRRLRNPEADCLRTQARAPARLRIRLNDSRRRERRLSQPMVVKVDARPQYAHVGLTPDRWMGP
jgi:hypothetical protein